MMEHRTISGAAAEASLRHTGTRRSITFVLPPLPKTVT
jgi:hypothetical protein